MPNRPRIALKVADFAANLTFYVDLLGFTLVNSRPDIGMAHLLTGSGTPILLAGPQVEEVRNYLDEPRIVFKPGDTLDLRCDDLVTQQAKLVERGLTPVQEEGIFQGDRKLVVKAPDGYRIEYVVPAPNLSPEELLPLYAKGGDEVADAIVGLTEADLDLMRAPGEWTIRQTVHHLAESASLFLLAIKSALAQSGSTYVRNPYDQEHWVEALDYRGRPIEPSLMLIQAVHRHISQLLYHLPDPWDRYIMMKFADEEGEGEKITVGELITMLVRHTTDHCEEIRQTRQMHHRL